MTDPIDSAFQSRRFAHGKSKGKSGRGGGGVSKPFNPLSALGRYEVSLGASTLQHTLEVHELTEDETGLLGTFDFEKLGGVFVLAGSRKGLAEIITEFEEEEEDEDEDEDCEADDGDEESDESNDDAELPDHEPSAIELEDEKANRRARAFEKNSFRNPKFWMRWKGTSASEDNDVLEPRQIESDMGYLVFANNACDRFDGTITCPSLDWKQLKMKGRKAHSRATPCPVGWNDIG